MSMEKLAAVESILGSSISAIDTKTEQAKLTLDAKNKAKKLFGDAKERKDAKKKEKKGPIKEEEEDEDGNKIKKKKKVKQSLTQMMMKAELKTEEDEQEKERKRKEKLEKIEAAAADRKKKQKRVLTTNDRLLDDKIYLSMLADGGIGIRVDVAEDIINEDVSYEAKEALDFLNSREKFWDQLELGSENEKKGRKKATKTIGSLRWLM